MFRRLTLIAAIFLALAASLPLEAAAALILSADGNTVLDTSTGYTWLANADLAGPGPGGTPGLTFGIPTCATSYTSGQGPIGCVTANGTTDYQTALAWVAGLNKADYEGHTNWQLPITTAADHESLERLLR